MLYICVISSTEGMAGEVRERPADESTRALVEAGIIAEYMTKGGNTPEKAGVKAENKKVK